MIEKDNIQELFSRSLENHTAPVRPEVWDGLQAKMAAAGVSSGAAAVKGISALTKWLIGSAAVTGTAVVTTLVVMNSGEEQQVPVKQPPVAVQATVPTQSPSQDISDTQTEETPAEGGGQQPVARHTEQQPFVLQPITPSDVVSTGIVPVITQLTPEERQVVIEREKQLPVVVPITEEEPEEPILTEPVQSVEAPASVEFFPNVFSPNGDGVNDQFYLTFRNVVWVSVTIIDAQNNNRVVFSTENPDFKWDGTVLQTGEPAPEGMYGCILQYRDKKGETHKKTQLITLTRQ